MNDIKYIEYFCENVGLESEAKDFFVREFERLSKNEECFERFVYLASHYMDPDKVDECISYYDNLFELSNKVPMDVKTLDMVFLIYNAQELEKRYEEKGIDKEIFWNLMMDLKYKIIECKKMYGIYGTFVFNWFRGHYLMRRFGLGRFQFEYSTLKIQEPITIGEITLTPGMKVYNFHIPSSGVSLSKEIRLESYKLAKNFFEKDSNYIVFTVGSWLLFPEYQKVFPEGSNIKDFASDFKILKTDISEGFPDAWRVFYKNYSGDTTDFPRGTTLQKNFIKWLDEGGANGSGYGVIVFDGEKIID